MPALVMTREIVAFNADIQQLFEHATASTTTGKRERAKEYQKLARKMRARRINSRPNLRFCTNEGCAMDISSVGTRVVLRRVSVRCFSVFLFYFFPILLSSSTHRDCFETVMWDDFN